MTKIVLVILLLISTLKGIGQWNNNTAINNVVSNQIGSESQLVAISDGANGSIVFFVEDDIIQNFYAQKITAAGSIGWGNTGTPVVICKTTAEKYELAAIPDGNGGAFITWSDYRHDASNGEIYVQRINSAGVSLWGTNGKRITSTGTQDDVTPVLCTDGAGGIIVAWYWDNGTSNTQSFAQRFNGSGDAQWTANGMQVCTAPGFRGANILVSDGNNGALIFFVDTRNDVNGLDYGVVNNDNLTNADIYGQRLNGNGVRLWTDNGNAIITASGNQYTPDAEDGAIADGAGGAIIVFEDQRNNGGSFTLTNLDIFSQRINASGASLWTLNGVSVAGAAGNQYFVDAVSDGAGGAVLSIVNDDEHKLYAQKINATGNILWTANGRLLTPLADFTNDASITTDEFGNAIFTYGTAIPEKAVKAQKLDGAGNLLWGANGAIVCNAPANGSFDPVIVPCINGSAIIGWSDMRNNAVSGTDIYASKILSNGILAGSSTSLYVTAVNGNWNNPATWANGQIPPTGAAVVIRHIVTGNVTASCSSLKVEQPAGNLTVLTGVTITVTN